MLLKRTHRILEVLLVLVVLYLLLTRAFLTWLQYHPQSFSSTLHSILGVEFQYDTLKIHQNWQGFELYVEELSVQTEASRFQASRFDVDVNLFSLVLPTVVYGKHLRVQNAVFEQYPHLQSSDQSPTFEFSRQDLQQHLFVPESLQALWTQISIQDVRAVYHYPEPLHFHLKKLEFVKSTKLSLVAEFGVKYGSILNFETFSLALNASSNSLGGIGDGKLSLISYRPVKIEGVLQLLPEKWRQVLPKGEILIEANLEFAHSKLSRFVTRLNGQALNWPQNDSTLPNSAGMELEWTIEKHPFLIGQQEWNIRLLALQLDNQFLDTISPIELRVDDHVVEFTAKSLDIEPLKVLTQALITNNKISDLFGQAAHLTIQNLNGTLNWRTLELPELHFYLKTLAVPVTDFPSLALQDITVDKSLNQLSIKVPKPIWLVDTRIHKDAVRIDVNRTLQIDWQGPEDWRFTPFEFLVDQHRLVLNGAQLQNTQLQLDLDLETQAVSEVLDYLPYPWMGGGITKWLNASQIAGEALSAKLLLQPTSLSSFLQNGDGVVLKGRIQKANLLFSPKWPKLNGFDVDFSMQDYKLALTAENVALNSHVMAQDVKVVVGRLVEKNIAVEVVGRVDASAATAIEYLQQSPLVKSNALQQFLKERLSVQGDVDVNVNRVWIPVFGYDNREEEVNLEVAFNDASLSMQSVPEIRGLSGKVWVTEQKVSSKSLQGNFVNGPLTIDVNGNKNRLAFDFKGQMLDQNDLLFLNPLDWKAKLTIPYQEKQAISFESEFNLQQANSLIPEPFSSVEIKHPLIVKGNLLNQTLLLDWSLGDSSGGLIGIDEVAPILPAGKQFRVYGENLLGVEDSSKLLDLKQSYVVKTPMFKQSLNVSGAVDILRAKRWLEFSKKLQQTYFSPSEDQVWLINWKNSKLNINKLIFNEYEFPSSELSWSARSESEVVYRVIGPKLDASVVHSPNKGFDVNVANLDLIESALGQSKKQELQGLQELKTSDLCAKASSFEIPYIQFQAKKIKFKDYLLNDLRFSVAPHSNGYFATGIKGVLGNAALIEGAYSFNRDLSKSSMVLFLNAKKAEHLTQALAIERGFTGKNAKGKLQINWKGDVNCFNTQQLKGPIEFEVTDGVIEDVEPGLARLLGLLSVDSIVRRLKLSLSDVTAKGLAYDSIKATGQFHMQQLKLDALVVKAPSAKVDMKGDIHLNSETFDMKANVTPALGSTLPTVAALAGVANPLAAIAVYTLMKVIPNVNEELVTFKYKITGPWKEPKLELIK